MEHSQASFRFLDLPKEIRLLIYERLPRCIQRQEMCIYAGFEKEQLHQILTVILRTMPMAILSSCRQMKAEASALIQDIARTFILAQPPRLIFEAHKHFNPYFHFWILNVISEQAHRRVLNGMRHTLDRTGNGKVQS